MTIKCISLNLWDGGNLFPNVTAFLKEHADADILLLQEVYNAHDPGFVENYRSLDALRGHLNYPYEAFAPAMLDKLLIGKVELGNAILSKFPITASDIQFFNDPYRERNPYDLAENPTAPRILQHAAIDFNGTELDVYNLHGVWDLNGDNYSERRRKMSETIISSVQNKKHVLLAGDSNAKPTNPALRNIEEHLTSVFGNEIQTTYNMHRKDNPGYATAACDVMFVSPDIRIVDKSCPDIDISDHLPLIATLEIPNNRKEKQ
jgi:endonuclease/exonuclease/phosphatase family metal-dependent hydrolase